MVSACGFFYKSAKNHVNMHKFVFSLLHQFCNMNEKSESQGSLITSISTNITIFDKHVISRLKRSQSSIIENITMSWLEGQKKKLKEFITIVVKCVFDYSDKLIEGIKIVHDVTDSLPQISTELFCR